ncbi:DEAD/DEAH box helicase [Sulfurimonas hydrogeniphila]|uniref:DEAD/DEAH box helicase n=1 Tax=Sulfurimonas TaxID=202746 RepID=UPI00125EFAAA|nr:DEAD/DEAH box helicase [Sulfurimonas hydrogeniphila]
MITLRPYQKDIIQQATKAKGSVLVEAPTGSGKSVMASKIVENETLTGGSVLIVAPKITLLEQLADTFQDLNPQIIHGRKDYDRKHNVFVSTLQTAHKKDLGFVPSMIVIDEVHFGFSGKMIEQLLQDFKGKLVGLSATPYDKRGKPLQGFELHINKYDLNYMISNGYLVPLISYQPIKVNLKDIRTTAGDYNQSDLEEKFNTIESVMQVVDSTKKMIQRRNQGLVFGITIKHSEALADAYNDAGVPTKAIHSNLSADEQQQIMSEFKSKKLKLLTNPDMLTTGFDYPPCDVVVLARATKSQNLYKQMVGRVLRLAPNKDNSVLLDCAGVITDLGLPTAPIKPNKEKVTDAIKSTCNECGSSRVYRTLKNNQAFKVCAACGFDEIVESEQGYECCECGLIHGNDANFFVKDEKLFLKCSSCKASTVISEATTHDELKAIFDKNIVEAIKSRITAQYVTWLIDNHNAMFPFNNAVIQQIKALHSYIEDNPHVLYNFNSSMIKSDGWSIVEYKQKPAINIETLKQKFFSIKGTGIIEAIKNLNIVLEAEHKNVINDDVLQTVVHQINSSRINGIEAMTIQRLKNIYSNKKDCNSIKNFVPYIERKRGASP